MRYLRHRISALVLLLTFVNIAAVPFSQLASLRQPGSAAARPINSTLLEMVADLLFDDRGDAEDPCGPLDEETGTKSGSEAKIDLYKGLFSLSFLSHQRSVLAMLHTEDQLLDPDRELFVPPPRFL